MTQDGSKRKLAAILSADVKGYSILLADDEAFTIRTLKEYRGIMSNCIEQHNGRVVDKEHNKIKAGPPLTLLQVDKKKLLDPFVFLLFIVIGFFCWVLFDVFFVMIIRFIGI